MPADILRNNNDFYVKNGDFEVIENGTAVLQAVIERLRSFANEWFLDAEGLPYLTDVLGKPASYRTAYALILETIADTPGVALISDFDIQVDTEKRQYLVECTFFSVYDNESPERFAAGIGLDSVILDFTGDSVDDTASDPLRDLS